MGNYWSVTMIPADENQPQIGRNQSPVPPKVLTGLTLAASGRMWDDAASAVGLKASTLRRWHRTDPRCQEFIEQVLRDNLNAANNTLTNALPRLADELIKIALDQNNKAYARTAAISEAFKIVNTNVLEAEQRKQLQAIRAHLDRLEDGGAQVIDV